MSRLLRRILGTGVLAVLSACVCVPPALSFDVNPKYDVNKYWHHFPEDVDETDFSDSRMCWAATASNVLTYAGWGVDHANNGYATEYDVYHEFLEGFPNEGGYGYMAYESYFDWHYPKLDYQDYYVEVDVRHRGDDGDYMLKQLRRLLTNNYDDDPYTRDYGVYASIWGHAVTVWGLSNRPLPGYAQPTYQIYISDSDDGIDGVMPYLLSEWSDGWWELRNYGEVDRPKPYFLKRFDALAKRPDSVPVDQDIVPIDELVIQQPGTLTPVHELNYYLTRGADDPDGPRNPWVVPEPATVWLLGLGLVGVFGSRRRQM